MTKEEFKEYIKAFCKGELHTENIAPPIPIRCFDWVAWIADVKVNGEVITACAATEEEAIERLAYDIEEYFS